MKACFGNCFPASIEWLLLASGGGVPAPSGAADDDDSDDDDSTVRSRVDGSPSLKRNELQTYDSTNSSVAGPMSGGLTIPSAAAKSNDDPGTHSRRCMYCWAVPIV